MCKIRVDIQCRCVQFCKELFFTNLSRQLSFLTSITLSHFQCTNNTLRDLYVPECESKVSSTRSDSRAKCRFLLSFTLFTFFISPQQLELSRDESRRWFQSADPWKSPSGSLTPPPSRASREFRSGKRKSGELQWWKRRKKRARGRETCRREKERMEVYSISILSYTRAILSQYRSVYHHHVWSNC